MNDSGWLLKRSYWLTAVLSAGTVLIAACGPPPAGLQLGADQDGSNSGGAAAGTGAGAGELPEELGAVASIDHFEDGDDIILPLGGRQGRWYAFGDGTGTMTPSSGAVFVPATGGPDDSKYHANLVGAGFSNWGAGVGFDLNHPDDGSSCDDLGNTEAVAGVKQGYDASRFKGVAFWAKGNQRIRVNLPTTATVSAEEGGFCSGDCGDAHGVSVVLSDEWELHAVAFDSLKQSGWGEAADFDSAQLLGVQFYVKPNLDFDISVDDVVFFGGEDLESGGAGGGGGSESGPGASVGLDGLSLAAGFRSSRYGINPFPEPAYWAKAGNSIAGDFAGATAAGIWIVGEILIESEDASENGDVMLTFPQGDETYDNVQFAPCDQNEAFLDEFDESGAKVWLQVESGIADVPTLIDLVLDRYQHHPSVIGVAVDAEWHDVVEAGVGEPITDAQAAAWVAQVRQRNPHYTVLLKHWLSWMMPPTERDGLIFVNDAQGLPGLEALASGFEDWGQEFYPAAVGFQVGYETDKNWWGNYDNPTKAIGDELRTRIPNMKSYFWVDFTLKQVVP